MTTARAIPVVQPTLEACVADIERQAGDLDIVSKAAVLQIIAKRWPTVQPSEFNGSIEGCKIVSVGDDCSILVDTPGGSRRRYWLAGEVVQPSETTELADEMASYLDSLKTAIAPKVVNVRQQIRAIEMLRRLAVENKQLRNEYHRLYAASSSEVLDIAHKARWVDEVSKVANEEFDLNGCCHWESVCDGLERLRAELAALRSENENMRTAMSVDTGAKFMRGEIGKIVTENEQLRSSHAAMVERLRELALNLRLEEKQSGRSTDYEIGRANNLVNCAAKIEAILAEPQAATSKNKLNELEDVCMDWLASLVMIDLPEEMQELRLRMSSILSNEPQAATEPTGEPSNDQR